MIIHRPGFAPVEVDENGTAMALQAPGTKPPAIILNNPAPLPLVNAEPEAAPVPASDPLDALFAKDAPEEKGE